MSRNLDNPSTRWFFNDWENEPGMKFCGLAAQGLWFKMLSLAARSREYGVVLIGDHPSLREDLPALLAPACGETVETIGKLIDDLITFKVAAVDGAGRVINRRMVREAQEEADREALSAARAAAGRAGAAVTNGRRQNSGKREKQPGKPSAKSRGNKAGKTGTDTLAENAGQQATLAISVSEWAQQTVGNNSGKIGPSSSSLFLSSVSKDTGADAPIDLFKVTPGGCLAYLIESGQADRTARNLLGRWRKDYGDKAVLVAVDKSRDGSVSDPVAYINACLRRGVHSAAAAQRISLFEAQP